MTDTVRAPAAATAQGPRKIDQLASEIASENNATNGNAQAQSILLSWIKDSGAQMRVEMRVETVNDYANDMLNGVVFPPVIVFHDGNDYWLGDGFHRVEAARKIGREAIVAEIRKGSARDAILHGVGSNASHGLRRTQADKRRAVERLLKDPEWGRWSDRKICRHSQGRPQNGRHDPQGTDWGIPHHKADWGIPHRAQAERSGLPAR